MPFKLSCLAVAAAAALFANSVSANVDLKLWTDAGPDNCAAHLRAKVVAAKAKKGDVLVRVKLDKSGKSHTATVGGARPADFKVGSPFCAQDYSGD